MMGKKNFAHAMNLGETIFVLAIGGDKFGRMCGARSRMTMHSDVCENHVFSDNQVVFYVTHRRKLCKLTDFLLI